MREGNAEDGKPMRREKGKWSQKSKNNIGREKDGGRGEGSGCIKKKREKRKENKQINKAGRGWSR